MVGVKKKMDLKKVVPILAVMAMMMVFLVAMQPASAASKSEIKVYPYDQCDPPGAEVGKELSIYNGEYLDLAATLHIDGGNPQWFRWVTFYVYDSKGKQIVSEERNSGFGGIARCWINSKDWDKGTYKVSVVYGGNTDDGYPRVEKYFKLNII